MSAGALSWVLAVQMFSPTQANSASQNSAQTEINSGELGEIQGIAVSNLAAGDIADHSQPLTRQGDTSVPHPQ